MSVRTSVCVSVSLDVIICVLDACPLRVSQHMCVCLCVCMSMRVSVSVFVSVSLCVFVCMCPHLSACRYVI